MDVEKMFDTAVHELERILTSKTVIGDPITIDGRTMVPLVSVGFGFGAGGGTGAASGQGEGSGGGVGGGGGVRPVALLVMGDDGVQVQHLGRTGALERVATTVGELVAKQRQGEGKRPKGEPTG